MGQFGRIQEGFSLVLQPPPVQGIGQAGGFKMQVEDRSGRATPQQLQAATDALIAAAGKDPQIAALFTTFRAGVPQLYANVDRVKAKKENVAVTDVFQALQVYLGSFYINEFNYLGRTYKVIAQADARFRALESDVAQLKTRNAAGAMVPLGTVMELKRDCRRRPHQSLRPLSLRRNQRRRRAGRQQRAGHRDHGEHRHEEFFRPASPTNGPNWRTRRKRPATRRSSIFPLCVLFVFLTHSAEYESFALSLSIILIVPMCLLCGIAGVYFSGLDNNIFTQIGFVVLAGMSVKNAVLIVEFAKQQQEHDPKMRRRGCGRYRGQAAPAADSHDEFRVHFRRAAAVVCHRRRRGDAARLGHGRVLRHDRRHILRALPHARLLHRHPQARRRQADARPAGIPQRSPRRAGARRAGT